MNSDPSSGGTGASEIPPQYRRDQRKGGWFNVVFGILFLGWTACDLIFGEFWYPDVFFALMGVAFVVFGVMQVRDSKVD